MTMPFHQQLELGRQKALMQRLAARGAAIPTGGRTMGEITYAKQQLAKHLMAMEPGQKAMIIDHNDVTTITRNADQIEDKSTHTGTEP